MTNAELDALAKGLTKAQENAIYPGPGNPEYARGPVASMKALERLGAVTQVNCFSTNGKRGARLTPLGLALRNHLRAQEGSAGGEVS